MINSYLSLYTTITHWGSVEELTGALNFTTFVAQDTATYLAGQGVGDAFAYEIVESSTRVNYGQNLNDIHGMGGMCSMAATGSKSVKGGNFQVFENFLKESKAAVYLNTPVTGLESAPDGHWLLSTKTNGQEETRVEEYDAVIIAAPFDRLAMKLPAGLETVNPVPYVNLHVTLLATTSPSANSAYFNQDPGYTVPSMVLTTAQGIRAGGPAPEFNSLSYHGRLAEGRDEWVVKAFSEQELDDEWLSKVFGNVGWVHRKVVSAI